MDNASRELEITAAKEHHMALLKKKKEDKKRDADTVFNDWTETVTLDSIMLSPDLKSIKSISSRPVGDWNMKHMRFMCSKFKISGYKNRKRDEMVGLLLERKRNEILERKVYAEEFGSDTNNEDDGDTGGLFGNDNPQPESESSDEDSNKKMPSASSPTTRSASAKAAAAMSAPDRTPDATNKKRGKQLLTMESSKKKSKASSKSTVPSSVTVDGTYYRAINVWFDERNRLEIVNMGSSPTIKELDARKKFANKPTYDKLLLTYLDISADNMAIDYIGFDDQYLNDCGISDEYASQFDTLTSEDLCKVLDYVVYWYNVADRNNKTSGMYYVQPTTIILLSALLAHVLSSRILETGNHADFNQFVGSRPYVYYYHLWLLEIPHLRFLAVPELSNPVFRISMSAKKKKNNRDIEEDDANSTLSDGSSVADADGFIMPSAVSARKRLGTTPSRSSRASTATPRQDSETKKADLLQSHLRAVEERQIEAAAQQKAKHVREARLGMTVELKTIEELLVMKKQELKAFDSEVDSDSEKLFLCEQIKKLRKKQRALTALVYPSSSDDEDK